MKAIILGATGAVGRDLTQMLLKDSEVEQVDIFVRRKPDFTSDKLKVHIVDFNHPEQWSKAVKGDVLFLAWEPTELLRAVRKISTRLTIPISTISPRPQLTMAYRHTSSFPQLWPTARVGSSIRG